jgi:M6 family metalloprotease-like protein
MAAQSNPKTKALQLSLFSCVPYLLVAMIVMVATLGCSMSAETRPLAADTLPDEASLLVRAAEMLGWAAAPSSCAHPSEGCYELTPEGDGTLYAAVSITTEGEPTPLDDYERQGMLRGLYRGREAIIVQPGDPLCPRQGASDEACTQATGGLIAWRHGPYVFSARDHTGAGRESAIAEALWRAAEQQLGALPGTVVILADTEDTPGSDSLLRYRSLARSVDRYYALNAYGRVDLASSFMDADGDAGDGDWYSVGSSLSSYAGREDSFAVAAVQAAFAGADLPEMAYTERIIVVCPATPSPFGATRNLFAKAYAQPAGFAIEVQGREHPTRIHVPSLVVISEEDQVGSWVHEIGHTLYARHRTAAGHNCIVDRYGDGQGQVGPWDLMGSGSRWGNPEGSLPVHMSSFTKETAGWLHYVPVAWEQTYAVSALENQRIGEGVLALDDPLSEDPRAFYIIEARDNQAFFGAPEAGVLIYHVAYDEISGAHTVDLLAPQAGDATGQQWGVAYERPTLHGASDPAGAQEYVDASAGFRVTLLAESLSPYVATVRVERY